MHVLKVIMKIKEKNGRFQKKAFRGERMKEKRDDKNLTSENTFSMLDEED